MVDQRSKEKSQARGIERDRIQRQTQLGYHLINNAKLLKYRACIQSERTEKTCSTLRELQKEFADIAYKCKATA